MKTLILLNGYNLRRYPRELPGQLQSMVADSGHTTRVCVSKSMDHLLDVFARAADANVETVLLGGGDGTLHHAINHPAAKRVAVGMIPLGTINAFLRSAHVRYTDPVRALREILHGRVIEGYCGQMNERRFACFASWGYDARVVHRNPTELKRVFRAASYGMTGVTELVRWRAGQTKGALKLDRRLPQQTTSVIVSKIDNYAGLRSFRQKLNEAKFDVLVAKNDDPLSVLGFWTSFGVNRLTGKHFRICGTGRAEGIRHVEWRAPKPTHVQMDGEAITLADNTAFDIRIDRIGQRYWWPR